MEKEAGEAEVKLQPDQISRKSDKENYGSDTMKLPAINPSIEADSIGIHFLRSGRDDIVVEWGEIDSIDAAWSDSADGPAFLEVSVNHISGVDFRFQNVELGYEQVMASIELHLIGFSRDRAEAEGTWAQKLNSPVVWKRDISVQPLQLCAPKIVSRDPSDEELKQMESAHRATISTCEKLMGRPLTDLELECIYTGFENGRIVGNISNYLRDLVVRRQAEILGGSSCD